MKGKLLALGLSLITLVCYLWVAGRLKWNFPTDPANYFSHLSWSILNGRLDLINPAWNRDLSFYNGKLYMYWGPTPVLLVLPVVFLFGVNISDVLYTAIFSSLAPFIIFLSLQKMEGLKLIKLSDLKKIILSLFFAFGTVYLSVAVKGGVWFTSQAVNTMYILISIYFIFSYLSSRKIVHLILASVFLGLAGWGRATFVIYMPLFLVLIYSSNIEKLSLKSFFRKILPSISTLIIILAIIMLYNYLRFGSIFENGYIYQNMDTKFISDKINYGDFNLNYVNHNLYYNFINPPVLLNHPPFLKFDPEGNSFLILSPFFLLTPLILRRKHWRSLKLKILNSALIFCILFIILVQINFFGTGWFQFNARYLLDTVPLLILLLAQIMDNIPLTIILPLVVTSIFLNTAGTLWLIGVING